MNAVPTALLRGWRLAAVALLAWMVWKQTRWLAARAPVTQMTLAEVQRVLPAAAALAPGADDTVLVSDAAGEPAGSVLRTSPHTDDIRGYSGPNDILIGLDPAGKVTGIHLRHSGDTPDHAALVEKDAAFAAQFRGWEAGAAPPQVHTVTGATLTSAAIVEAVQIRLAGGAPSLRFPDKVTLEEVRAVFPAAAVLEPDGTRLAIRDAAGTLLGRAVRTSPAADNVSGFRGPTEALIFLTPDEKVAQVRVRRSYDTESYVQQVRSDEWFLAGFHGRTAAEIAQMDFTKERIEGVSGATETSWAIAEGMKRRLAQPSAAPARKGIAFRDLLTAVVLAGGVLMAFTRLRGMRRVRLAWQTLLVAWALWTGGDLISLALLGGWAQHGVAWQAAPGAALMAAAALLLPWGTRRQVYCHQLCPHGAAQEWLGRARKKKLRVPPRLDRVLRALPWLLLTAASLLLMHGVSGLHLLEPFDAWAWRAAALIPLVIAAAGLVAAVFIPQAYCRYGCPTGALLGFMRSSGSGDRWGRKDVAMLVLLALSGTAVVLVQNTVRGGSKPHDTVLAGQAMGSTWEVKLRHFTGDRTALERDLAAALESLEAEVSVWRAHSAVSQFNAARSTAPQPMPAATREMVQAARSISEATGGAFDITTAPLVKLWGYGPPPRPDQPPSQEEVTAALTHAGWQKITAHDTSLTKSDPQTEIDLTALTEGLAADRIASLLEAKGARDFLINISGELHARGRWTIGIEHPARSLVLENAALATSGTYRQQRPGSTHLLDARTGHPVTHRTISVSVRHPSAMTADAWATALNILGTTAGLPLAEHMGLAAEFTDEDEAGNPLLRATTAWR